MRAHPCDVIAKPVGEARESHLWDSDIYFGSVS
jgi:hypothetical protein